MQQPNLGKKVVELRQSKGLTQVELAENCNLSIRTIQRIESGEGIPRSYTIKVIFSYFGCDFNDSSYGSGMDYPIKKWLKRLFKYIFDFFNFKVNTMKQISVLSIVAILVTAGLFMAKTDLMAQKIDGWFLAGTKPGSYKIGLDKSVYKTGNSSAFLESTDTKIDGFGTLMQTCLADDYLGKRVKMTAYIKSKDVSEWAGMWLRVDAKEGKKIFSFDNMQDRPVKGTNDWTKCEIILDVPSESGTLNFGVLLQGTGKLWFDNVSFEIVDKMDATTDAKNKRPTNLDFKE